MMTDYEHEKWHREREVRNLPGCVDIVAKLWITVMLIVVIFLLFAVLIFQDDRLTRIEKALHLPPCEFYRAGKFPKCQ